MLSSGGTEWIVEDVIDTRVSTLNTVHVHWLSSGDTKHILTVLTDNVMFAYSPTIDTCQPAMDKYQWKLMCKCSLFDNSPRQRTTLTTWVHNRFLVYCSGNEMHFTSKWSVESNVEESAVNFDLRTEWSDGSDLEEATVDAEREKLTMIKLLQKANLLWPSLPQYHPSQLLQLLQYGKVVLIVFIIFNGKLNHPAFIKAYIIHEHLVRLQHTCDSN